MSGHYQGAHSDEHNQGGNHNAVLERGQDLFPVGELVYQTFRDEYRVIVSLSENERCKNHVHYVELHSQKIHYA